MDSDGAHESELASCEPAARTDVNPPANPDLSAEPAGERTPNAADPVPPAGRPAHSSRSRDELVAVAASFYHWLSRPRVRLTLTGAILLLIGGPIMTNSVWTMPLVIVGALMVLIGWIGSRLDGRFAIEWGETGTQLEFRAKITAAPAARTPLTQTSSSSHKLVRSTEPEPEDAQIIDGEAHTVEIEVAELEALIAAVHTTEAENAQPGGSRPGIRDLRVARNGRPSEPAL
jgi:hypothetical protein